MDKFMLSRLTEGGGVGQGGVGLAFKMGAAAGVVYVGCLHKDRIVRTIVTSLLQLLPEPDPATSDDAIKDESSGRPVLHMRREAPPLFWDVEASPRLPAGTPERESRGGGGGVRLEAWAGQHGNRENENEYEWDRGRRIPDRRARDSHLRMPQSPGGVDAPAGPEKERGQPDWKRVLANQGHGSSSPTRGTGGRRGGGARKSSSFNQLPRLLSDDETSDDYPDEMSEVRYAICNYQSLLNLYFIHTYVYICIYLYTCVNI